MQKARDGAGEHTGKHRRRNRDERVDAGNHEHGAHAAAEREAAVDGEVGDVEKFVGDVHTEDHDAPQDALGNGAEKRSAHVVPPYCRVK